jgi:hypothetical protein
MPAGAGAFCQALDTTDRQRASQKTLKDFTSIDGVPRSTRLVFGMASLPVGVRVRRPMVCSLAYVRRVGAPSLRRRPETR